MDRHITRQVNLGQFKIGGDAPILVQSMLNAPAHDIEKNIADAKALEAAGCQAVRIAVPDFAAVDLVPALKEKISIPVIADIHFNHEIALRCIDAGIDKIRINPGNIGARDNALLVADACRQKGIPMRIGVNSGSVEEELLIKYGGPTPEAMAVCALNYSRFIEESGFKDIVISLKSSSVQNTIEGYRFVAKESDYPLHLGVTEAGTERMGILKSAVGIGSLLCDGIGDTIRVSLTADPVKEVSTAFNLLNALDLLPDAPQLIACPTCGRTQIDLISIANEVENRLQNVHKPIKVAVMGCPVNGPGEAKNADVGIAGGKGCGLVFKKGEIIKKVPEDQLIDELFREIERL